MRRFLAENGLSVFFLTLFLVTLVGQSFAGQHAHNAEEIAHGGEPLSWIDYVLSPSFGGAVLENWQSEFLQFTLFILATVWLVQKGSNESKRLDDAGIETKKKQRIGGEAAANAPRWAKLGDWRTENHNLHEHGEHAVGWTTYVRSADFWERSLQNWQSEFLAVGTMVVFTIYLRQRGSPESKPVGAPHDETATSG